MPVSTHTSEEIRKAHSINCQKFTKNRLPAHKGQDKDKKLVADLLNVCLDPQVKLPVFPVLRLHRFPPACCYTIRKYISSWIGTLFSSGRMALNYEQLNLLYSTRIALHFLNIALEIFQVA